MSHAQFELHFAKIKNRVFAIFSSKHAVLFSVRNEGFEPSTLSLKVRSGPFHKITFHSVLFVITRFSLILISYNFLGFRLNSVQIVSSSVQIVSKISKICSVFSMKEYCRDYIANSKCDYIAHAKKRVSSQDRSHIKWMKNEGHTSHEIAQYGGGIPDSMTA